MFAFVGAHLGRQFEFVQSEWINDGDFFGAGDAKDPVAGSPATARRASHPAAAGAPAPAGPAAVRRHPRRRVLLHARPARPALARRPRTDRAQAARDRRPRGRRRAGRRARRAPRRGPRRARPRSSPATSSAAWRRTTGPVPVRTLAHAARLLREARQLGRYGIAVSEPALDYPRLLARVREVVERRARAFGPARAARRAGRDVHERAGTARFVDPHTIETDAGPAAPGRQDHPLHRRREPAARGSRVSS